MNNDLISREELRKCAIPCVIHNGALTDMCVPLYQIDNAPTVEPDNEYGAIQYSNGFNDGFTTAKDTIIQNIAKQYSEHNELVPVWLSIGDMRGGAE